MTISTLLRINNRIMHYFASISGYAEINDNGNHLILCHYPIMFYNHSYSPNCWMLCGHVHNTRENTWLNEWKGELRDNALSLANNRGNIINAGCMLHNYTPKTINQLIEWDKSEVWRVTEV
jgi:calcineurin-like phosphoesterase family protein